MTETWYFKIFDAIFTLIIFYFGHRFYAKHHDKKTFEKMLKNEKKVKDFYNKLFKKEKKRKQGPFL